MHSKTLTILDATAAYLDMIKFARSANTTRSYKNAVQSFLNTLSDHKLNIQQDLASELPEDAIAWFAARLKNFAPATEQMYLTAIMGFYEYLAAERLAEPNLPRLRMLIKQRGRKPGQRLPQFPRDKIEEVLIYAEKLVSFSFETEGDLLRNLRDRAFLLTLADTGLRVHEACGMQRGNIDWNEGRAIIIGKGNREAVVRFSQRSLKALRDYLEKRATIDGSSGRPLPSLPLFARHDRGAGSKVKPITTTTGRNIVHQRVLEALGTQSEGTITPHSFRHYFVTTVLRGSGGNLKLAQELARHKNIAVTQRYAHLSDNELDQGYWNIFEAGKKEIP